MSAPSDDGESMDDGPSADPNAESTPRLFWIGLIIGWVLIGIGVRSAVMEVGDGFGGFLVFLGGFAVAHDALVLPAAAGLSIVIDRVVPPPAKPPVRLGLAMSWVLLLVSLPGALAFGARPDNPSILPVNIGRNLAILVALTWVVVAVVSALRMRSMRPDREPA